MLALPCMGKYAKTHVVTSVAKWKRVGRANPFSGEVPRNPPALHAGPLRFFTLKGYNVLAQKKLSKKMLCHMVASRCKNHFFVLANGYRLTNLEIEQLANLKRTLRILANEWLVQWFQGFKNVQLFARQIVPRRNLIVPHEMSVKIRRERRLLIA